MNSFEHKIRLRRKKAKNIETMFFVSFYFPLFSIFNENIREKMNVAVKRCAFNVYYYFFTLKTWTGISNLSSLHKENLCNFCSRKLFQLSCIVFTSHI